MRGLPKAKYIAEFLEIFWARGLAAVPCEPLAAAEGACVEAQGWFQPAMCVRRRMFGAFGVVKFGLAILRAFA